MSRYVLAVTGSRHWTDERLLRAVLDAVTNGDRDVRLLVHGGARGADLMARQWAIDNEIETLGLLPAYELYGKRAPLVRNAEIVTHADKVIAFRAEGYSGGTDDTVAQAEDAGKLMLVIKDNRPFRVIVPEFQKDVPA